MSDYIQTYSRIKFTPLAPQREDIAITDIAHALSMLTRANGHLKHFYSVGQHSLNCCYEACSRGYSLRVQLACLLHDASESYLSDITRPVKRHLPAYYPLEENLQQVIFAKYGIEKLTRQEQQQISAIDDALLYHEFLELTGSKIFSRPPRLHSCPDLTERPFSSVKQEFLQLFYQLTGRSAPQYSLGIDACRGQWVAVCLSEEGVSTEKFDHITALCQAYPAASQYLIDIPIGLPDNADQVRPEAIARQQLGRKAASLFSVPCRQAVYANSKTEARQHNMNILGRSLSEQSLGLCRQIRQIDEFLNQQPQWRNRLQESHPEFCFVQLNNSMPLLHAKQTAAGREERLAILQQFFPAARRTVNNFLAASRHRTKVDDIIDALCLAVMGQKILQQGQQTIPSKPMSDSQGNLMQIVFAK